jgi:hypothetical protein
LLGQASKRKGLLVSWRMIISNIGDVKSFADDLNIQRSIVSGRVPLLVRSAEIKLLLDRFVLLREHLSLSIHISHFTFFIVGDV